MTAAEDAALTQLLAWLDVQVTAPVRAVQLAAEDRLMQAAQTLRAERDAKRKRRSVRP